MDGAEPGASVTGMAPGHRPCAGVGTGKQGGRGAGTHARDIWVGGCKQIGCNTGAALHGMFRRPHPPCGHHGRRAGTGAPARVGCDECYEAPRSEPPAARAFDAGPCVACLRGWMAACLLTSADLVAPARLPVGSGVSSPAETVLSPHAAHRGRVHGRRLTHHTPAGACRLCRIPATANLPLLQPTTPSTPRPGPAEPYCSHSHCMDWDGRCRASLAGAASQWHKPTHRF